MYTHTSHARSGTYVGADVDTRVGGGGVWGGGTKVISQSLHQCFVLPSHRWLTYLLLLILDLVICLTMCLWMAKQSRWLLIT